MRKTLTVVSLCALLTLGVVASVQALPDGRTGSETYWYSDETFSVVVGERFMECNGGVYFSGVRTNYVSSSSWSCQDYSPVPTPCNFWICDWPTDDPNLYNNCSCV